MPVNFFVISGPFDEVNLQLALNEAATIPPERRPQAIADDIDRSAFIDSDNKTITDYKNRWSATPNSSPFSQGIIDGSFYQPILDNYLLNRINEYPTDYVRDNHPTLGFAYFDDQGIPCAVSIHYLASNPAYWTVSIIRNTTAEPQDREVFVMCTPYLVRDLVSGNDIGEQKNPNQAKKEFSTFLNSKKINTLLKNVIQGDGEADTKKLGILQTMIVPNMKPSNQDALTERTNEANNRVDLFVIKFKHELFQALTDRHKSVDAILSRENIKRNNNVPTAEELTGDFDKLMTKLNLQKSLQPLGEAQEISVDISPTVSYQLISPERIIGQAKIAGFTETEINKLTHAQLLLFASAVYHSFGIILSDLEKIAPPHKNLDLTKYNDFQTVILDSCNKLMKEIMQAYLSSVQPDVDYDAKAYSDLLNKIQTDSEFVASDNSEERGHLTLMQPEVNTENTNPADTPWATRVRQVSLAILAMGTMGIVGFLTAPLILSVLSTVISGLFAAVATGLILAAAVVAIGALFYGVNKLIEVYQAKQNEPPTFVEESQPLSNIEPSSALSNQMTRLGQPREVPVASAPLIEAKNRSTKLDLAEAEKKKKTIPQPLIVSNTVRL